MNNRFLTAAALTCALAMLSACGSQNAQQNAPKTHVETEAATAASTVPNAQEATSAGDPSDSSAALTSSVQTDQETEFLTYIDAWEEWHTMEVDPTVSANIYDPDGFICDDESGWMTYSAYEDGKRENGTEGKERDYSCLQGIDVSEYQGLIDWSAVADAGCDFAFIRVGYRGYGKAGNIFADDYAVRNLQEAKANGLMVGAYFFSQALNEEEAREEAALALEVIEDSGVALDLPLIYDPEIIKDDWGRANDITRGQVKLNTAAFREYVENASEWKVDIYSNLPWEHEYFDSETLNQYAIWYADYEKIPQTPYHFSWWQYSNEGSVPGIEGDVDLNLWIRAE